MTERTPAQLVRDAYRVSAVHAWERAYRDARDNYDAAYRKGSAAFPGVWGLRIRHVADVSGPVPTFDTPYKADTVPRLWRNVCEAESWHGGLMAARRGAPRKLAALDGIHDAALRLARVLDSDPETWQG